jgi:hypothetical protein
LPPLLFLILPQLHLQASLLQPDAALTAFHPTSGAPAAYQLLLSCLQDAYLPAAQQLLLLQLLHTIQQQAVQLDELLLEQRADPASTSASAGKACSSNSSSSSSDAALIWPEFVLTRLAGLAVSAETNTATAGACSAADGCPALYKL